MTCFFRYAGAECMRGFLLGVVLNSIDTVSVGHLQA